MSSLTEQFSAATASAKSHFENQLDIANHYASTAFEGVQQVIHLNFNATKASVERTSAAAKQLLEAKDPRELVGSVHGPSFDNLLAYSSELYNITSKTQSDLLQLIKDQFQEVSAAAATVAAKPLALASKVAASAPAFPAATFASAAAAAVTAPVAAVSEAAADTPAAFAPAPAAAPAAAAPAAEAAPLAVEAAQPAAAEEESAELPSVLKAAKGKPVSAAKPIVEAVAELGGKPAAAKPLAADVSEGKPVVLKSVAPKK